MKASGPFQRSLSVVLGPAAASVLALLMMPMRPLHADEGRTSPVRAEASPQSNGSVKAEASAQPNGSVNTEVMILHATNQPNGGTGIDPQIGSLPALRQPPFSSYNSYKLISRNRYPLAKSAPAASTLPNDRVLQISLREVLTGSRYRVATSINQPGGTTFLPLLEVTTPAGEPFFVAGQSYKGGMLVIGITIVP